MNLQAALPQLLPLAIAWAEAQSKHGRDFGSPLNPSGQKLAKKVGVKYPELIRIVAVENVPMPEDELLLQAAGQVGLFGPDITGLTLGYSVFLCARDRRAQLLAHECRHVAQYESFGSIAAFLTEHLKQVAMVGYYNSPLEKDARAYENCVP